MGFYSRGLSRRSRTHGQTRELKVPATNAGPDTAAIPRETEAAGHVEDVQRIEPWGARDGFPVHDSHPDTATVIRVGQPRAVRLGCQELARVRHP
jgi:hypothetical protein